MSSGRAFLDARKSFERYSVAPNCCLMLFPQDVRKFEKPQFSEQIWKSPLLLKIFRHNVAVVSAIGSNKISLESHTNTFQLVNSILPASQAKPINQNARVHISNSVFVLPKTSKNHRVFRKKQKNIWGVPKMVVLRFLKNDHFGVCFGGTGTTILGNKNIWVFLTNVQCSVHPSIISTFGCRQPWYHGPGVASPWGKGSQWRINNVGRNHQGFPNNGSFKRGRSN